MVKSNNILFILAIVLLLVSVFGTFALLNSINFVTIPAKGPQTTQQGEIKLTILPGPGSMSTTGYIGVNILPEE